MHIVETEPAHDDPALDPAVADVLRTVGRSLWARRYIALGTFALCVGVGVITTVRAPRVYFAAATVLVQARAPNVLDGPREVVNLGVSYWTADNKQYYATQYALMSSTLVAEAVAQDLGLGGPELRAELRVAGPESPEALAAGTPLHGLPPDLRWKLRLLGFDSLASRQEIADGLADFDAAMAIRHRITARPISDTQLVDIGVEGRDPQAVALLANSVARAYIRVNLEQRTSTTTAAVDWLADQRATLQAKFEDAERKLDEFRRAHNMVSVSLQDRQNMVTQTLESLNRALAAARVERLKLQGQHSTIENAKSYIELEGLQIVIKDPLIRKLKGELAQLTQSEAGLLQRYTDQHPNLIEIRERSQITRTQLKAEIDKICTAALQEYANARDTELRLKDAIEQTKSEAFAVNTKETAYNSLKRERDTNEALYAQVLKRLKETNLTQGLTANNVRLVEEAKAPHTPVRPRTSVNLMMSLFIGIGLGIGMALLVEYLDDTIKSPAQVESAVGLAFLGLLPAVKNSDIAKLETHGRDPRATFVAHRPNSNIAECCRAVRTNLLFMSPDDPARSVLVTSSDQQEGKSTVASNLALVIAQSGTPTLLVDADMRRPRIQSAFGISDGRNGLSNLILGHTDVTRAVRPSGYDNLDILACGPLPPNPAELLHAERFRHVVEDLAGRYERIIFDSPPVGAVTDAVILASMVDGVVFVLREGAVSVNVSKRVKRQIEDVGGRILGAVINGVDLSKNRYHYRNYSRHYYRHDYLVEDENAEEATPLRSVE